jgi:hypothetical protein
MAGGTQTAARALGISAQEAKRRLESGEQATVLDVRNPNAWASSNAKIRGAVRIQPDPLHVDPAWPKNQFTLVY